MSAIHSTAIHVTTEATGVEALVVSVQSKVSRIAYQYHRPLPGQGHEDLLSIGMAEVVSAAVKNLPKAKFPSSANKAYRRKRAYLLVAARRAIVRYSQNGSADPLKRPSKVHPSSLISLDGSDGFSLYDEIASPGLFPTLEESRDFGLLYEVLDTLPDRYRQVICMRFGLCGYGVHRPCEIARTLRISQDAVHGRLRSALVVLRQHPELLSLVGTNCSEVMPMEAPGGAGGDHVPTGSVATGQGDEEDRELARLMADFEAIPSYVEVNAALFAMEVVNG